MDKNKYITSYGYFCTLVVTIVGIGIFSYPREVATVVGGDAWVVTLITGALNLLLLRLVLKSIEVNGYRHITVIARDNLGEIVGGILLVAMAASNIISISLGMRSFVEVIKMYLLEKTPTEFLLIVTILCGLYIVRGGIISNVRFNEITFWIMFIPMFIILAFALSIADFTNILPVLDNPPDKYLEALTYTLFSFGGLEIVYLVTPLLNNKVKAFSNLFKGMTFITVFYIIVTVLCIAVFSVAEIKNIIWPTMTMIRTIDIPGSFIERWDGVVLALWIIFFFTTFSNGFTFSSYLVSDAVSVGDIRISSLILVPFIYIIAMYPTNISELYDASLKLMPVLFVINIIIVPIILIVTSRGRHHGEEELK